MPRHRIIISSQKFWVSETQLQNLERVTYKGVDLPGFADIELVIGIVERISNRLHVPSYQDGISLYVTHNIENRSNRGILLLIFNLKFDPRYLIASENCQFTIVSDPHLMDFRQIEDLFFTFENVLQEEFSIWC